MLRAAPIGSLTILSYGDVQGNIWVLCDELPLSLGVPCHPPRDPFADGGKVLGILVIVLEGKSDLVEAAEAGNDALGVAGREDENGVREGGLVLRLLKPPLRNRQAKIRSISFICHDPCRSSHTSSFINPSDLFVQKILTCLSTSLRSYAIAYCIAYAIAYC